MPQISRLKLPPVEAAKAPLGQRLARLRKERGFTQVELAERVGIIQALVSDYERGRLRLSAEMALRFARALEISTDDLLQPFRPKPLAPRPSRRLARRLQLIEQLPKRQQAVLAATIDAFLKAHGKAS